MLASLLPGIRDLRTPLAAGYIWICVLWVALGSHAPPREEMTGLADKTLDLLGSLPNTVSLAALTFVAYLIGASINSSTWPISQLNRLSLRTESLTTARPLLIQRIENVLTERQEQVQLPLYVVGRKLCYSIDAALDSLEYRRKLVEQLEIDSLRELEITALALSGKDGGGFYDTYDRKQSEAEFRMSVAIPITALAVATVVVFLIQTNQSVVGTALTLLAGFLVVVLAVGLFLQGARLQSDASSTLIQLIHLGEATPPTLLRVSTMLDGG